MIITVTNTNDSGAGSLRQAIANALAGDTIAFASSLTNQTITLSSGQLTVNKNLIFDGAAAANLKISGNNASRVFEIQALQATFRNLIITNGRVIGNTENGAGAGIKTNNSTVLIVENCQLNNNVADYGGGAIFSGFQANTTVINSKFNSNNGTGANTERGGGAIATKSGGSLIVKGSEFLNGGAGNDILIGGAGIDTLIGGTGIDRFDYRNLANSVFNSLDVITDFNAAAGNDLFLIATARSVFSNAGNVTTFDPTGITAKLTTVNFGANAAAQFTFGSRTFVAINDATAGFSATTDAIIEVTGLTGTLSLTNFTTVTV
ncbi:hypothetical protein MEN98_20775 [Dolichospermum sp. ST_sed8]|nr:hypothetical protein [Dolichospermum sp. ST_sed8]